MKKIIEKTLREILGDSVDFTVEYPASFEHGDYSTNAALINARNENTSPREYAEKLVSQLNDHNSLMQHIDKIEVAGPGFINFWINQKGIMYQLNTSEKNIEIPQTIMLEFAHPNTHKAFHIGHLLNIITGQALSNLWEEVGHTVHRVNYQGDVGMHIAKALYGLMHMDYTDPKESNARAELLAKAYVSGNKAFEEDAEAKNEIIQINKSIYKKDNPEIIDLYTTTRGWSLEYFDTVYARVGTIFDRLYFESEVFELGIEKVEEALQKGILEKSDGAIVYKGEKDGLHTRVFLTNEGNPTYEGKELGLAEFQLNEYHPDKIVHLVGKEQKGYFEVAFKVIEQLYPELVGKEFHQVYGWVSLKGGKMSSRKGNVVLGMWLLDEVKQRIHNEYSDLSEEQAELITQAAVKYAFLKTSLTQDVAFDIDESISLNGNSGPYLQYTVVRAVSVLQKVGGEVDTGVLEQNPKLSEKDIRLMRLLSRFNEIIIDAAKTYSPSTLATYLYDLASEFNGLYNSEKIIGDENQEVRLAITKICSERLEKGLKLLGIQVPDKM